MNLLEIGHMRKNFGGVEVLKDISLSVRKGEVVSIIGPSGSGKSTLLRCATMLEKMDGGELKYLGEAVAWEENGQCIYAGKQKKKEIRKHFGLVFQNFNLFPHYSVMKNITDAPISVDKVPKKEAEERAMKLLCQLGLEDKKDAYPYQLSGGQQQRVAIARAIATEPEIIYFDEPTSALDPELTGEVLSVMRQLADEGMTMLVVTHEMGFARNVSSKVMFMEDGTLVEAGSSKEFFANPKEERTKVFLRNVGESGRGEAEVLW